MNIVKVVVLVHLRNSTVTWIAIRVLVSILYFVSVSLSTSVYRCIRQRHRVREEEVDIYNTGTTLLWKYKQFCFGGWRHDSNQIKSPVRAYRARSLRRILGVLQMHEYADRHAVTKRGHVSTAGGCG